MTQDNSNKSLEEELRGVPEGEYGEFYRTHCLEMYKLYVEMADKISARRQTANSFFLSINTAIIAAVGYVQVGGTATTFPWFRFLIGLAGLVLCFLWYGLVRSYRQMNSGKFKVVHQIEAFLPLRPYDAEWTALGLGKDPKRYRPFTALEMCVPWVFFTIHLLTALFSLPWATIGPMFG